MRLVPPRTSELSQDGKSLYPQLVMPTSLIRIFDMLRRFLLPLLAAGLIGAAGCTQTASPP